jgi:hypothetical protein
MPHINGIGIISTALAISLGALLGVHTYLLMTNSSTIDMGMLLDFNPFQRTSNVLKTRKAKKGCCCWGKNKEISKSYKAPAEKV